MQRYVSDMERERHFDDSSLIEQCLKLSEEAGEVCKAVRKHEALPVDPASTIGSLAHELADVLICGLSIANRGDTDLTAALRDPQGLGQTGSNGVDATAMTLADLQHRVASMTNERLLSGTLIEHCLLLSARVGNVCAEALTWRAAPAGRSDLAGELIGVLQHLAAIANLVDLDLATALRSKEAINETRVWARPRRSAS
ncbi:MazG nucleotide pyrophosphohydrolase domain-containing protein [Nonomuraea sp. NPDC004702]